MKGREDKLDKKSSHRAPAPAPAAAAATATANAMPLPSSARCSPALAELQNKPGPSQFEKDAIGGFVLKLYHGSHMQPDGLVLKETVRRQFREFVKDNRYEKHFDFPNVNIETLLRKSKFLINTPRKSYMYRISIVKIIEFRNQKLKALQKNFAGSFLLNLFHEGKIQKDGLIPKSTIQNEFKVFLKKSSYTYQTYFRDVVVGTLLRSNNFLFNTPRGSDMYAIGMKRLFEYRNDKLKQFDESRINNHSLEDFFSPESTDSSDKPLEALTEVSADAEEFPVIYQGGCKQEVVPNFILTNLGCFICQKNFEMQSRFEDHISDHGFESDFKCLSSYHQTTSRLTNIFEINYRLCNKSHFFNFTMKSQMKDVIILKIVIVQTRFMHYVKNNKVPYEISTDGIDSFLVDSHLFTIGVEQPIVVVYRYKFDKTIRFVEEHHFLRTEEFPKVHFPIRSCRLPFTKIMKNKYRLEDYYPNAEMKKAQKDHFSDESLCRVQPSFREYFSSNKALSANNMCRILDVLLQIEDLEGMKDYLILRQKGAKINRFGREYSVKLRGIPKHVFLENIVTPLDEIILITDIIDKRGEVRKRTYNAVVENVYNNQICFKYDHSTICENKLYDIILRPSRLSLKYQFRALNMLSDCPHKRTYLFPSHNFRKDISTLNLELFNSTIENNPEQLQAVRNITEGPNLSAPYVIFGPPGTGKTSTVVEAVLQLWKMRPETRILITAGSNSACDEVALRLCRVLIDLQPEKMNILRVFAKSNEKRRDNIDDILLEASNFYRSHFYPDVEVIREYRIVVCTLSVVGKLVSGGIGADFFTHVFIDECAASTLPEALVAWMGTSTSKTRLIISGDHKQLGPILRSNRANELGLGLSYMEHLMNERCYAVDANGDYDRSIQTRLVQNFRSHPEIVRLYNHLYYNNELKPMANDDDTMWALQWHLLPNKNHPIIFQSVYGSCRKSGFSTSLCNELEINAVIEYVKDLMYFGIKGRKIEETDIGIISPYKKQYSRIREELDHRRWNQIEVGAVETFQGKEKPIIIVSTVRSFTKTLGFLDNPRRLNVILSRAKTLLIIIGNPRTLSQNEDFKYIIDECRRKKCTIGGFRGYNGENLDNDKVGEVNLKKTSSERSILNHSAKMNMNSRKSPPKKPDIKVITQRPPQVCESTQRQINEVTTKSINTETLQRQVTKRNIVNFEQNMNQNSFVSAREYNYSFSEQEEQRVHRYETIRSYDAPIYLHNSRVNEMHSKKPSSNRCQLS